MPRSSWRARGALAVLVSSAVLTLAPATPVRGAEPSTPAALAPATVARIDALLTREVTGGAAPGLSLAVVRDGRVLLARGYGLRDLATRARAHARTVYPIGSLTKQFTAAAMLLLQQDGVLSIDDPLSRYVPELDGANSITLRELLDQRSGLPDYTQIPGLDPERGLSWRALAAAVNLLPPESAPDAAYRYNNLNYLVLGKVIERATGISYGDFIRRRILLPFGLDATGERTADSGGDAAVGYTRTPRGFARVRPWSATLLGGAGVLRSTVVDLARWDSALFDGAVLSPAALAAMETPVDGDGYAMGWKVERDGDLRMLWHDGEVAGFQAMNAVLPDQRLAIVLLTNVDDFGATAADPEVLARRILGMLEPAGPFGEQASAQTAALPADPLLAQRVRTFILAFERGRVDRSQLTPEMDAALTPAVLAQMGAGFAGLGAPGAVEVLGHERESGVDAYVLRLVFARGPYVWKIALTADGKLAGAGTLDTGE